jgi:hypothetical protein
MIGSYVFAATVMRGFSAVPAGLLWLVLFALVSTSSFFKVRLFWSSARNFVIGAVAMTIFYHILFLCFSRFFEQIPSPWQPGTRLAEIFLTGLCALPMFWILQALDRWTLNPVTAHE